MHIIIGLTEASDGTLKSVYVGESRAAAEKTIRDAAASKGSAVAKGWIIPNPTKYRLRLGGAPVNATLTAKEIKAMADADAKAAEARAAAQRKAQIAELEAKLKELKAPPPKDT